MKVRILRSISPDTKMYCFQGAPDIITHPNKKKKRIPIDVLCLSDDDEQTSDDGMEENDCDLVLVDFVPSFTDSIRQTMKLLKLQSSNYLSMNWQGSISQDTEISH